MPRVNVTVTDEQHSLLLELSELKGGSAAGFLRRQLDASTPLLRAAVPLLRQAARETELSRAEASKLLEAPLREMRKLGLLDQLDLIDDTELSGTTRSAPQRAAASEAATRRSGAGLGKRNG